MKLAMTKMTKCMTTLAAFAALALFGAAQAHADAVTSNDYDALTITITPNVDRGVDIDTGTTGAFLNLGTLTLGATAFTTEATTVTVLGTINDTELSIDGDALTTWALDANETASQNDLQLYAVFTTTAKGTNPVLNEFASADNLITGAATNAGVAQGSEPLDGAYENEAAFGSASSVDGMNPTDLRHLWFRADLPPITTVSTAQTFKVTLTAIDGSAN